MAAGSIIVDLLMRTGSFETDTKRAEKALANFQRRAVEMGRAAGIALAAVGAAAAAVVKSAIDSADATSKMAQKIGITTEALSELTYAAQLSDVSQEQLGGAMVKLSKGMSDAARGTGEAAAAFAAMGIEIRNTDGTLKSADKVLSEVAGKFADYEDGVERTALAVALFGKSGADMIPLLLGGADGLRAAADEARQFGLVLDTDTGKKAEAFNDNLTRLGAAFRGLAQRVTADLLDSMLRVSDSFVAFAKDADVVRVVSGALGFAFDSLVFTFKAFALVSANVAFWLDKIGTGIGGLAAQAVALAKFDSLGAGLIGDEMRADADKAAAALKRFEAAVLSLGNAQAKSSINLGDPANAVGGGKPGRAPRMAGSGGGGGSAAKNEAERYLEQLQRQLQGTKDLSVAQTLLADIEAGRLGKVLPLQRAELLAVAQKIDQAIRLKEQTKAEADQEKDLADFRKSLAEEGARNFENTRTPLEKLNIELARQQYLLDQLGPAYRDTYERAVFAAQEAADATKQVSEEMDSFGKEAAQNLQDYFGGAFADAMDGNFKSIGANFTKMINRMVAEALAADLARRMFGSDAKGGSGSGWISQAIGAIGAMYGGAKATGGDVISGRAHLVGERGPEMFVPRTNGRILPNTQTMAANNRAFTQHLNINVQGQVNPKTASQISMEAGRAVRRAERMIG